MTSVIGARSTAAAGWAGVACMVVMGSASSHVAGRAHALEGVLALVVHGTATAFGDPGGAQLGDALLDRVGIAADRVGDVHVAERAIALAVACEVQRHQRDAFTMEVEPARSEERGVGKAGVTRCRT